MLDAARALPILVLGVAVMFGASAPSVAARDVRPAAQPTPGLAVETLFEAAFPEDAIPERDPRLFFVRLRYRPGAVLDRPAVAAAEYVLTGSLVVRSSGRVVVQRGGSEAETEDIDPGEVATIGPGDVAVSLTPGAAQTVRNPGTAPATTLKVLVIAGREAGNALPYGFATYILGHLAADDWRRSALPVGPLRVRVERLTAAPGIHAPLPASALPVLRYVETGELHWAIEAPATLLAASPPTTVFRRGQSLPWQPQPPDRGLLLHSSGEEPLVLLVVTLEPG